MSRALLVVRAGPRSLHPRWLEGARGFDVLVSAYDARAPRVEGPGIASELRPGTKVAALGALLRERRELLARYDRVGLADDDLEFDAATADALFGACAAHGFRLAQPALTHDSHFTYAALLRHPGMRLRHVTFVEMMFPVFETGALMEVAPLFGMGLESGIDLVWCNALHRGPRDFAVIDAHPVRHTRPVGQDASANGFGGGRSYESDIARALGAFGLPWLPCLPYGGIASDGRAVGRGAIALSAVRMAAGALRHRADADRAREIAVYARHLATRRAENRPVSLGGA